MNLIRKTSRNLGDRLTDKEILALHYQLCGYDDKAAGDAAGLEHSNIGMFFKSQKVTRVRHAVTESWLATDAAPMAFGVLYKIANDEKQPAGVRVTAAGRLLDVAGWDSKRVERQQSQLDDVTKLSAEQIQALLDAHSKLMVDITPNGAPNSEPMTDQELDNYE